MRKNKQLLQDKREQLTIRIRRKQKNKRYEKLRAQNMLKFEQYVETQFIPQKLQQLFDTIPQSQRPPPPYCLQQLIPLFPIYFHHILAPSHNQLSITILSLLQKLFSSKPDICSVEILNYLNEFISKHVYESLSQFPAFNENFLRLLGNVTNICEYEIPDFEVKQAGLLKLKLSLLKWCRGTLSLKILANCFNYPLSIYQFGHIYKIIQHALQYEQSQLLNCMTALESLIDGIDQDDSREINGAFPGILKTLISKGEELSHPLHMNFIQSIMAFLNTFQSTIIEYARTGLVDLVVKLFQQQERQFYLDGLMILNHLVYVRKQEMGKMLTAQQLNCVWSRVASLYQSEHRSEVILVYSIFSGFFNSYDEKTIKHVLLVIDNNCSIFNLIQKSFRQQFEDGEILLRGLEIIRTLLFYLRQEGIGLVVLKEILKRGFKPMIQNIFFERADNLGKLAGEIMEVIDYSQIHQDKYN